MGLEQIEIFEGLYRDAEDIRAVIYTGRGDKATTEAGELVASTTQEGLIRVVDPSRAKQRSDPRAQV